MLEIVFAPTHRSHAVRVAEQLYAYWPNLDVRIRPAATQEAAPKMKDDLGALLDQLEKEAGIGRKWSCGDGSRTGNAHAFDIIWVERWTSPTTHRSSILYTQAKDGQLPSDRTLWREVNKKIQGKIVLQNM